MQLKVCGHGWLPHVPGKMQTTNDAFSQQKSRLSKICTFSIGTRETMHSVNMHSVKFWSWSESWGEHLCLLCQQKGTAPTINPQPPIAQSRIH